MQQIIDRWNQDLLLERSLSKATSIAYVSDIMHFCTFLMQYWGKEIQLDDLIAIGSQDWRAWMSEQKRNMLDVRTIARRLSAVKSFFKFLVKYEYIKDHDIFSARVPKIPKKLPHPASYDYIMMLVDACDQLPGEDWVHLRDQALIFLLYSTGLRISEALNITLQAWHSNQHFLTVCGKGKKIRQVPLLPIAVQKINAYLEVCLVHHEDQFLFIGEKGNRLISQVFSARIRQLRRLLNFPDTITPHAFRHSCATDLIKNSNDLRGVQELLGHASLSTTQIYTGIDNPYLKLTYEKTHPRAKKLSK